MHNNKQYGIRKKGDGEYILTYKQEEFSSAIAANEPLEHNENIDDGGSRG